MQTAEIIDGLPPNILGVPSLKERLAHPVKPGVPASF
jgi:hypothetical protein